MAMALHGTLLSPHKVGCSVSSASWRYGSADARPSLSSCGNGAGRARFGDKPLGLAPELRGRGGDGGFERVVAVRSAAEKAAGVEVTAPAAGGGVTEVDKDTFWPAVKAAGAKLVVLDMYTQWCGPCKLMFPKVLKLSESYADVVFLKLDCNQANKALAKELEVKSVPTFKVLKNGEVVAEVRGAKYDELVKTIERIRNSP